MATKVSDTDMPLHSRTMVLRLLTRTHLSFFDGGCSYLGSVDYNGFRSLVWPWCQWSRSTILKISFMACKHILLIYFMVFIFGKMIPYGV